MFFVKLNLGGKSDRTIFQIILLLRWCVMSCWHDRHTSAYQFRYKAAMTVGGSIWTRGSWEWKDGQGAREPLHKRTDGFSQKWKLTRSFLAEVGYEQDTQRQGSVTTTRRIETFIDMLLKEFTPREMRKNFSYDDRDINLIFNVLPSFFDVITDLLLAYQYFTVEDEVLLAFFTLLFIFLPGLEWWSYRDQAKLKWRTLFLLTSIFFPVSLLVFKVCLTLKYSTYLNSGWAAFQPWAESQNWGNLSHRLWSHSGVNKPDDPSSFRNISPWLGATWPPDCCHPLQLPRDDPGVLAARPKHSS